MIDIIAHSAREILQKVKKQEDLNALREIKAVDEIYIIPVSYTHLTLPTTPYV